LLLPGQVLVNHYAKVTVSSDLSAFNCTVSLPYHSNWKARGVEGELEVRSVNISQRNTSYESYHHHGNLQLECEYSLPTKYPMKTLVRTGRTIVLCICCQLPLQYTIPAYNACEGSWDTNQLTAYLVKT